MRSQFKSPVASFELNRLNVAFQKSLWCLFNCSLWNTTWSSLVHSHSQTEGCIRHFSFISVAREIYPLSPASEWMWLYVHPRKSLFMNMKSSACLNLLWICLLATESVASDQNPRSSHRVNVQMATKTEKTVTRSKKGLAAADTQPPPCDVIWEGNFHFRDQTVSSDQNTLNCRYKTINLFFILRNDKETQLCWKVRG